jgi:hypothetical protein
MFSCRSSGVSLDLEICVYPDYVTSSDSVGLVFCLDCSSCHANLQRLFIKCKNVILFACFAAILQCIINFRFQTKLLGNPLLHKLFCLLANLLQTNMAQS